MIYDLTWPYVSEDSFKNKKKSRKKSNKKKIREPWSDDYSDLQYIYKKHGKPTKKSKKK